MAEQGPPSFAKGRLRRAVRVARTRGRTLLRGLGLPLRPRAYVVYDAGYATSAPRSAARHAIDVRRADRIISQLERAGVCQPRCALQPGPVSREDLLRVHPEGYLDALGSGEELAQLLLLPPGHGLEASELLEPFLLQTGGTILAAETALREGRPAINLGGGFHHAQRDRAEGFCPINDIAVAILRLRQRTRLRRALVVDLDYHQGNGTALIFSDDEDVFTLSVHGQSWSRVGHKRNNIDLELPPGTRDGPYLCAVRETLTQALAMFRPQLVFYVAGADPHVDDDLGDFAISDEGMLQRDLYVLEACAQRQLPVVVVLGGGYGPLAWTVHYNMTYSLLTGAPIHPDYRPGNIEARYRRVKERLTSEELKTGMDQLCRDDFSELFNHSSGLFLDYYTPNGLEIALERYGFLDLLRERGFTNLKFFANTDDPDRQIFRIHYDRQDPEHLLVELVARYRSLVTPEDAVSAGLPSSYRMLSIEWLMMQDPRAAFSLERRKLPGQRHPGLGLGRWMVELLRMMAERLDCAGLMNIPQHYHNAYLYSKQMLCFHAEDQGYLEAMKRDLSQQPLVETSEAIDQGRLRDADSGQLVTWEGRAQVMPVRPELNAYFNRSSYIRAVAAARERYHFRLELG